MRLEGAAILRDSGKNRRVEGRFDSVFQVLPQVLPVVLDQKSLVAAAFDDGRSDRCWPDDRGAATILPFRSSRSRSCSKSTRPDHMEPFER